MLLAGDLLERKKRRLCCLEKGERRRRQKKKKKQRSLDYDSHCILQPTHRPYEVKCSSPEKCTGWTCANTPLQTNLRRSSFLSPPPPPFNQSLPPPPHSLARAKRGLDIVYLFCMPVCLPVCPPSARLSV